MFGRYHIPELVTFDLEDCRDDAGLGFGVAWEVYVYPPGGGVEHFWFYGVPVSETVEHFARERVGYYNSWVDNESWADNTWLRYLDIPEVDIFPSTGCTWSGCTLGRILDRPWRFSMYLLSVTWLAMLAINYVFSRRFRVLPWRQ